MGAEWVPGVIAVMAIQGIMEAQRNHWNIYEKWSEQWLNRLTHNGANASIGEMNTLMGIYGKQWAM